MQARRLQPDLHSSGVFAFKEESRPAFVRKVKAPSGVMYQCESFYSLCLKRWEKERKWTFDTFYFEGGLPKLYNMRGESYVLANWNISWQMFCSHFRQVWPWKVTIFYWQQQCSRTSPLGNVKSNSLSMHKRSIFLVALDLERLKTRQQSLTSNHFEDKTKSGRLSEGQEAGCFCKKVCCCFERRTTLVNHWAKLLRIWVAL